MPDGWSVASPGRHGSLSPSAVSLKQGFGVPLTPCLEHKGVREVRSATRRVRRLIAGEGGVSRPPRSPADAAGAGMEGLWGF